MRNKFLSGILAGLFATTIFSTASANNIDTYRNMMQNKRFTIKYEIVTPQPRQINSQEMMLYEGELLSKIDLLTNRQYKGVVVTDGDDRYSEVCYEGQKTISQIGTHASILETDETAVCTLIKGDDKYFFVRRTKKAHSDYYGNTGQKGKVEAGKNQKGPYEAMLQEMEYGNSDISPLLSAILPPDKKVSLSATPNYQFASSSRLNNGLTYEDYVASQNGMFNAVRYYFKQNSLVKIAAASYKQKADGSIEGFNKCIAKITEFSPVPDATYLSLPKGLEDVTKRDKKK